MIELSLLVSMLTGLLLVRAVWPGGPRWQSADWLRLPLGVLTGFGFSSIVGFAVQAVDPSNRALWIGADVALLGVAAVAWMLLDRGMVAPAAAETAPWAPLKWVALAAVATMIAGYALMALPRQTGDVDAWSIWNMRARWLYRGGSFAGLADPLLKWTHPEFPYLLSTLALRSWRWAADEAMSGPMLIAAAFVATLNLTMYGAVRLVRTHSQALLALCAVLGSALFLGNGAVQYADIPLAAFLFGSLAGIAAAERSGLPRVALIAGLCAGFAAWTKYEGVYYFAALAGVAFWRLRSGGLAFFAVGAVPGIAILGYFRTFIAPTTSSPSADPVALVTAIASKLFVFTLLGWVVTPLLVLAFYLYCVGLTERREYWFALGAMFVAGCLAIIVRDDNIGDAAAIRVILHLWAITLFATFVHAKAPEELMQAESPRSAKSRK